MIFNCQSSFEFDIYLTNEKMDKNGIRGKSLCYIVSYKTLTFDCCFKSEIRLEQTRARKETEVRHNT